MLRTALAVFMAGSTAVWGQSQNENSGSTVKVDRASGYYHYMLAHFYAEKASAPGTHNKEYMNKASDNFKAALKADPEAPVIKLTRPFAPHLSKRSEKPER